MSSAEISKNEFSIKRVIRVIRTGNKNHHKKFIVDRRQCDVLVYIISGTAEYEFEDGSHFEVKAGDVMYLSNQEKYSIYITDENYRFVFCDFEFNECIKRKSAVFTPKNEFSVESLFVKLLNVYNLQSRTYFQDSLAILYGIYAAIVNSENDVYVSKSIKSKIAEAKKYIDNHYADQALSVFALAKSVDMSEVYFRKLFKNETGVSPSRYIVSVRLKKAKTLMRDYPFFSIDECALQTGFSSLQYFSRVFKKEYGIVPSKWRNKK